MTAPESTAGVSPKPSSSVVVSPPSVPPTPVPVKGPSFFAIFRTILFLSIAGGALFLVGQRWGSAFTRFRVFSTTPVASLLAPEQALSVDGGEAKKPRDVVFRLEAPGAKAVLLGGTFNGFDAREAPLVRGAGGVWEAVLTLGPGRYLYKFKVDGKWILDPSNPDRTSPPRQASVLEIQ